MNHRLNNSSFDWQELDRLVDGRLDEDAYRELLCQIDADPDGWKQCALAFLEHQALEKELGAFASDPTSQMLPCMGAIMAENDSGDAQIGKADRGSSYASAVSSVIGWMSMALCIIGGLALGFTLNDDFRDRLAPKDLPVVVEQGMNDVSQSFMASSAPTSDNPKQASSGEKRVQKKNGCKSRKSCWSQRNRTSLINFKSRTQESDPSLNDECPVFQFMDENE